MCSCFQQRGRDSEQWGAAMGAGGAGRVSTAGGDIVRVVGGGG